MLREFGSERLIGMLHAFLLLKPVISNALKNKEVNLVMNAKLSETTDALQLGECDATIM